MLKISTLVRNETSISFFSISLIKFISHATLILTNAGPSHIVSFHRFILYKTQTRLGVYLSSIVLLAKANLVNTLNIHSVNDEFHNNQRCTSVNDNATSVNSHKNSVDYNPKLVNNKTYSVNETINVDAEDGELDNLTTLDTDQIFDDFFSTYATLDSTVTLTDTDIHTPAFESANYLYEKFAEGVNDSTPDCTSTAIKTSRTRTVGNLDLCMDCTESTSTNHTSPSTQRLSSYSTKELCNMFDSQISALQTTWEKPLFIKDARFLYHNLNGREMIHIHNIYNEEKTKYVSNQINILSAVKDQNIALPYIYFDTHKYPIQLDPFENSVWITLKNHIQAHALKSGYALFTNGGSRRSVELEHREFRCYKGVKYRNQSKLQDNNEEYRKTSMINDKSKSRGSIGRQKKRRRGHHRPIKDTCHFNFTVCIDEIGYHVRNGRGVFTHKFHINHSEITKTISAKHLPKNIKNCLNLMNSGYSNLGNMRNVIYKKTGTVLALPNIRYLCQKLKNDDKIDIEDEMLQSLSSVDKMIKFFSKKKYDYYCLLHTNTTNIDDLLNGISTDTNKKNQMPDFIRHCNAREQKDILKFIKDHREDLLLNNAQHLMLSIAWVVPQERRLFNLYPEVLFIDITSDTNKEKRPLFTITGRSAMGTMFTILRAFLPNQKTWMFRWLFSLVLANSFTREVLSRVRVMITDGDSQETSQLDVAISENEFFSKVHRVRCGYHLNKKNWEKNGPTITHLTETEQINCSLQTKIISDWIYSWMKQTCETELQYLASKYLLLSYLENEEIISDCGTQFIDKVKRMIRENIEPNERFYVFYRRKYTRHFGEYSNSAHEGTNHGLKYAADGVKPSHLLDISSERLSFQGERNYEKFLNSVNSHLEQNKSWNHLPCSKHLIPKGAALLVQEYDTSHNYEHQRINYYQFLIRYKRRQPFQSNDPVARWANIRKIELYPNTLKCSCGMYEKDGLVCRHVFYLLNILKHELVYHDIDIRWWLSYAVFAYSLDHKSNNIDAILTALRRKEVKGPNIKHSLFECIPIDKNTPEEWFVDTNNKVFSLNHDIIITREEVMSKMSIPFGLEQMSQLSFDELGESNQFYENITGNHKVPENITEYHAMKESTTRKQPYLYLKDTFSSICATLEGLPSEYTSKLENDLNILHKKYRQIAFDLNGGQSHGTIISSSLADSRKKKTHGVNKYNKKRKKR